MQTIRLKAASALLAFISSHADDDAIGGMVALQTGSGQPIIRSTADLSNPSVPHNYPMQPTSFYDVTFDATTGYLYVYRHDKHIIQWDGVNTTDLGLFSGVASPLASSNFAVHNGAVARRTRSGDGTAFPECRSMRRYMKF
ncbi:MAG: hypothetical protein DWQ34_01055 [Planctomycetota bacterium]|nr:MAG: hypothetical protein DWQ34_01055 [Planctomycetota bacterium]